MEIKDQIRPLKIRNCLAYGLGDLYGGGSFFIISTFAMYYLIAIVGMNPLLAGLIPGLGKVWDSVSDPLMGYISDRTKSRFGRRRVYFLIAVIPIALSFTMIWMPVAFSSQISLFLYYFFAYLFFYTTSTLAMVPYSALSAEMTRGFKERNKLTGFRMFFSLFATLLAGVLAQPLIYLFDDPKTGHLALGVIFGLFFAIPWIFLFLGTWELPVDNDTGPEKVHFLKNFISIFKNRSFRIHITMYIFAYGAMDIMMAWLKFYLVDYLDRGGFMTIGLGSILITQILVLPLYIAISNRRGHAFSFKIGLTIWGAAMILFSLHTHYSPMIFLILNCIMIGAGMGAGVIIPYQLLPFVTDVDEMITGRKRAGTYSGSMSLIRKLIQGAVVLPLLGLLLAIIGYLGPIPEKFTPEQFSEEILSRISDPLSKEKIESAFLFTDGFFQLSSEVSHDLKRDIRLILDDIDYKGVGGGQKKIDLKQSSHTLSWMKILFILCPIAFIGTGLFASFSFQITPENHSILMHEIERLKSGGLKENAQEETIRVCELLTGQEYGGLYR
ncbi:MAG: MFS transporter [Spirochaetaceae bacterium]|nr:MFS transporter [Spirochaetaceae bacterium]